MTCQGSRSVATGLSPRVLYGITAGMSADVLLRGQLSWLRKRGWDVTLVADRDERAARAAQREGVAHVPVPMSRAINLVADLKSLAGWVGVLRCVRPDVVNVSTPKAGLLGGIAAAVTRVPRRVYVMRGLRMEGARGVLRAVLWAMERLTVLVATDIVVVSASLGAQARRHRLLGTRPVWLIGEGSSNGVDAGAVAAAAERGRQRGLRASLGFAEDDVVVGYIGRIAPDKGVATLLDALSGVEGSPVRGLLVGSPEGMDPASLGSRVVHVDWTDDVWQYYSAMDILCLPTRREGFPNVVLEAAAAGVPAITTRSTGAVDSVVDGKTGVLVDVDDVSELRCALVSLAHDTARLAALGAAARDWVRTEFQPERIWSGVESIMAGRPADHLSQV